MLAADEARWDTYAETHQWGSPFHLVAWKRSLEATFGYQPRYLLAEDGGGAVRGVLPMFLVKNPVIGKALISTPFAVYGGALFDGEEAKVALAEGLREEGEHLGVDYADLRNAEEGQCLGFTPVNRYVTFTQEVRPQNLEGLLTEIPKKTRNMVRKAYKTDFEARHAVADWRPFERLHSLTLRRLGTPSFPPQHFGNLVREFGSRVEVGELRYEGRVAAASLCFVFRQSTHIYYACTDPDLNHLAVNYRMYAELLLRAGERGSTIFDFGRSKLDTGTFEFKKHWLSVQRPLPYEMLLVRRKALPDFTPKNPKFFLPIEIWKRLPLPVTRVLGPRLIRLFP